MKFRNGLVKELHKLTDSDIDAIVDYEMKNGLTPNTIVNLIARSEDYIALRELARTAKLCQIK